MYFDDKPRHFMPIGSYAAGDPASLGELWNTAREAQQKLYNDHAISDQLTEEYDLRIDAVREATGVELTNPLRAITSDEWLELGRKTQEGKAIVGWDAIAAWRQERFKDALKELATKNPDAAKVISPERLPQDIVRERVSPTFQREGDVYARAGIDSIGGMFANPLATGATFGGAIQGWFRTPTAENPSPLATYTDPLTLLIGGVTAKSSSLLYAALKNAAANAGAQAVLEPGQREQFGLIGIEYGLEQSLQNIAAAGLLGGVIDPAFRAPIRGVRRALGDKEVGGVFRGYKAPDAPSDAAGPVQGADAPPLDVPPDLYLRAKAGDQAAMAEVIELARNSAAEGQARAQAEMAEKLLGLETDLAEVRKAGEKLGLMDDPAFRGALQAAEANAPLDAEARATLREMGVDDGEGLRALIDAARTAEDPDVPLARAPEPVGEPRLRWLQEEADALSSEYGGQLRELSAATRPYLDRVDPTLAHYVDDAVAAGLADILPLVRAAAEKVSDGTPAEKLGEGLALKIAEYAAKVGPETLALNSLVRAGRGTPTEAARLIRSGAEVDASMPLDTPFMRTARDLAALSDPAFAAVEAGEVPAGIAAVVGRHVPDEAMHAGLIDELKELRVGSEAEALDALTEILPPQTRQVSNQLLGVRPGTETSEMPLRAGADVDEPGGAKAKAQSERLAKELGPEIAQAAQRAANEGLSIFGGEPTPLDSLAASRGVQEAIEQVAGMVPEGLSVRVFSGLGDLPAELQDSVIRANGVAFADALRRFQSATTDEARAQARQDMDAIKIGHGVEALTQESTVYIAAYALNPKGRIAHEVVHGLKAMGKLGADEVQLLAKRARKSGAFDPGREQLYRTELEGRGLDPNRVAELLDEEAAAHVIEARINGQDFGAGLNSIVDRVRQILEMIGNALRLRGFKTADDVIEAIVSGEVARREGVASWMRENDLTAVAVAPTSRPVTAITERGFDAAGSRISRVTTPDGVATYPVQFEVVDAASLTPASGELQPRDRATRAASQAQVQEIAGRLNPDLLVHSAQSDRGAPIVDANGTVLSGNGRLAAINAARQMGAAGYGAYLERLKAEGFDAAGIDNPVLVRRLVDDMDDATKRDFVVRSNEDDKLAMSPAERARVDQDLVTDDTLALLDPEGDAGLGSAANRPFVRSVLSKLSASQRGAFAAEDGSLTPSGVARLEAAVFAKAYGDRSLINRIVEDQDGAGIRNALIAAAPSWAQMRAVAPAEFDITPRLVEAVQAIGTMRERRLKPAEFFAQADAFTQPAPEMQAIVRAFYNEAGTRAAAWRSVRDTLKDYARVAMDQGAAVGDLMGQRPTPVDILEGLLRRRDSGGNQPVMFAFAGPRSRTADLQKLRKAGEMEKEGKSREAIWKETGWFRGVDLKWRYEISDLYDIVPQGSDLREVGAQMLTQSEALRDLLGGRADTVPLGEIFDHPELFEAYPDLPITSVEAEIGDGGAFGNNVMSIGATNLLRASNPKKLSDLTYPAKVVMHESQHFIQDYERYARGGTEQEFATAADLAAEELSQQPPSAGEAMRRHLLYRRLAGEVEARLVERRLSMTPEERKARPPFSQYDTPASRQLVKFQSSGPPAVLRAASDHFDKIDTAIAKNKSEPRFAMRGYSSSHIEAEARKLMRDVGAFEQSLWDAGSNATEVAAAITERYGFEVDPAELAAGRVWWHIDKQIRDEGKRSFAVEYDDGFGRTNDPLSASVEHNWDKIEQAWSKSGFAESRGPKNAPGRTLTPEEIAVIESASPELARASRERIAEAEKVPLTAAQKREVASLSKKGWKPNAISEALSEKAGGYVSLTSVVDELERAGLAKAASTVIKEAAKGRNIKWTDDLRAILADESLSTKDAAKQISAAVGFEVPGDRIKAQRSILRRRGEMAPSETAANAIRLTPEVEKLFGPKRLAGMTSQDVASELSRLVGRDVSITEASKVRYRLKQKGVKVGEFKRANAELEAFILSDEVAGLTRQEIAERASERFKRHVDPQTVWRIRKEARDAGLEVPETAHAGAWPMAARALLLSPEAADWSRARLARELAGVLGYEPSASNVRVMLTKVRAEAGVEAPARGFKWTDEALATLTSRDVADMSVSEIAELLRQRFGTRPTNRAVMNKRTVLRQQIRKAGGEPNFALRDTPPGTGDDVSTLPLFASIGATGLDQSDLSAIASRVQKAMAENLPQQAIADTLRVEILDRTGFDMSPEQADTLASRIMALAPNIDQGELMDQALGFGAAAAEREADDQAALSQSDLIETGGEALDPSTPLQTELAEISRMREIQKMSEACRA